MCPQYEASKVQTRWKCTKVGIPYRLKVFRLYMLPVKSFTGYNCFLKRDFAEKSRKFTYFSPIFHVFSQTFSGFKNSFLIPKSSDTTF